MKKVYLFMFSVFLLVIMSCGDRVSEISVEYKYENMTISIDQIYETLKDNLEYSEIELINVSQKESFYLFPKFGKVIIKPYNFISIHFNNIGGVFIEHINPDREYAGPDDNYLYIYSRKLGVMDQEMMELSKTKINEIVDVLISEYPEYFIKDIFIYYRK
jgi:hypothetical protein